MAAIPRVWAPDLVPFGQREAAFYERFVLGERVWPVPAWVIVRGLLDAVGVALLYLAARPLLGTFGGVLTALLYAASPWAWQLSRDPDGSLGPMLTAATMLAGVWLARRPGLVRGALFGLLLGTLAWSLPFGLLVLPLGVVALAVGRASWKVGGVTALALVVATVAPLHGASRLVAGSSTVNDPAIVQPLLVSLLAVPMLVPISAVKWAGRVLAVVLVIAGSFWIASTMKQDGEVESERPAFAMRSSSPIGDEDIWRLKGGWLSVVPTYREVSAMTRAMQETAARVETSEIILLSSYLPEPLTQFPYDTMLDGVHLDEYGGNVILPLERETVFLAAAEGAQPDRAERAVETRRPASSMRVFTSSGADTGLELFTLRPRAAGGWLARVQSVENGAFADGSRLLGIDTVARGNGLVDVALYWSLAVPTVPSANPNRRQDAISVRLSIPDASNTAPRHGFFPSVGSRRDDYLVLMPIRFTAIPDTVLVRRLRVTLLDQRSESIRTAGGDAHIDLPLPGLSR